MPTIALAGYTNVGKSTLLNALTGAEASIDDRLFETLDPTTRSFERGAEVPPDRHGGVHPRLPHELVEGFAATLEETLIADLVLHVVDASADEGISTSGAGRRGRALGDRRGRAPIELVLDKIDRIDGEARHSSERLSGLARGLAQTGEGLEALPGPIAERFEARFQVVELLVPYDRGDVVSSLYALGPPIELREDRADGVFIRARLPERETAAGAVPRPRCRRARPVIELPVIRLRDDASLPQGAYPGDAGLDLVACERVELAPGERGVIPTGIAVAIPEGYAGLVIPRSGLALEHGISLVNTPGLIDSGYRGELRVIAINTDRERPFTVEAGMRIAQLVVTPVPEVDVLVLDELPETVRGAAGFGSSGV